MRSPETPGGIRDIEDEKIVTLGKVRLKLPFYVRALETADLFMNQSLFLKTVTGIYPFSARIRLNIHGFLQDQTKEFFLPPFMRVR